MSIYIENGFKSRVDYLTNLAEDMGIPLVHVLAIAGIYGPNEDFDGLVTALEDLLEDIDY